ncbi:hypothetical protein DMN91_010205, partial [Ooceraea biroi]
MRMYVGAIPLEATLSRGSFSRQTSLASHSQVQSQLSATTKAGKKLNSLATLTPKEFILITVR